MRNLNFLLIAVCTMTFISLVIRPAGAFQVDSTLPDLKVDWNNTPRYNRGMRMIELKGEIDELCRRLCEPPRYGA